MSNLKKSSNSTLIVIVSNRGPITYRYGDDKQLVQHRTAGGLATTIASSIEDVDNLWIGVAGSAADREAFKNRPYQSVILDNININFCGVPVDDTMYDLYYAKFSNEILWFLQHYLFDIKYTPTFYSSLAVWSEGYVKVNKLLAEQVIREITAIEAQYNEVLILIQDYHLYLVGAMVKSILPTIQTSHFVHIPWPALDYWQFLPAYIVQSIIECLLKNDLIGFQTWNDAHNFLDTVTLFYPHAKLDRLPEETIILLSEHQTSIKSFPVSINPKQITTLSNQASQQEPYLSIKGWFDGKTILCVNRIDPAKNLLRGIMAFDQLLQNYGETLFPTRLLLLLMPERSGSSIYTAYAEEVLNTVRSVNQKYASKIKNAIVIVEGNDYGRALAAMRSCNVMLVNSLKDGMSLVAKEFSILADEEAILILSRTTGAFQEIGEEGCIAITPTDVKETSEAMFKALTMPQQQKLIMSRKAKERILAYTSNDWLNKQLAHLRLQRKNKI